MAGRSREPGAEVRSERMTVRWTKSELARLEGVRKTEGLTFLADVPRVMSLRQIALEEAIGNEAETLEKARQVLGLKSTEEALWLLAKAQLERMSSTLEKYVAE